jgi:hypothetical protein
VKSAKRGTDTSGVELTNVSQHGLWLLIDGRERYLPYDRFPWFRDATVAQLSAMARPTPDHIQWPELDVDLTLESIDSPEKFPLVSRGAS